MVEEAHKRQTVWSFLRMMTKDDERSVVSRAKEFEGGRVFERVYVVLFGELDGVWLLQGVYVD